MPAKSRSPTRRALRDRLTAAVKARWLKWIVGYCIGFSSVVIVACYVAAYYGVNTDQVLTTTKAIFGGELLMTAAIKLIGGKGDSDGKTPAAKAATTATATTAAPAAKKEAATKDKSWG